MNDLDKIFLELMEILKKRSSEFVERDKYIGSNAKQQKPAYHLYGKKEVSLFGKEPQPTYVAGVIKQKNYVSFYLSPIYSHPELYEEISADLKKVLKGKSCFNIKKINPILLKEIEKALEIGIEKYKELNWI